MKLLTCVRNIINEERIGKIYGEIKIKFSIENSVHGKVQRFRHGKEEEITNDELLSLLNRATPQIIEKIRFALPEEIFDEENKGLINWFQMELYKLPADEFLKIIGDVISEDKDRNKKDTDKFRDLMNTAFRVKQEYESYDEGDQGGSDDDDEGFDDFLAGLGLRRPE